MRSRAGGPKQKNSPAHPSRRALVGWRASAGCWGAMAGARRRAQPRHGALHRVRPRQGAPNVGRVRRARLTAGVLRPVEVEAASERQRHALHRLVRERAVEPRSRARAATPATQAYVGSLPDDDESRPPQLEVVVVVEEPARDEDRASTLVRADDRDGRAADELRAREAKPPHTTKDYTRERDRHKSRSRAGGPKQ